MNIKRSLLLVAIMMTIVPNLFGAAAAGNKEWGTLKNEYPYPIYFGDRFSGADSRAKIAPGESIELTGLVLGMGVEPEFFIYNTFGAVLSQFNAYQNDNYVFSRGGKLETKPGRPEAEEKGAAAAGGGLPWGTIRNLSAKTVKLNLKSLVESPLFDVSMDLQPRETRNLEINDFIREREISVYADGKHIGAPFIPMRGLDYHIIDIAPDFQVLDVRHVGNEPEAHAGIARGAQAHEKEVAAGGLPVKKIPAGAVKVMHGPGFGAPAAGGQLGVWGSIKNESTGNIKVSIEDIDYNQIRVETLGLDQVLSFNNIPIPQRGHVTIINRFGDGLVPFKPVVGFNYMVRDLAINKVPIKELREVGPGLGAPAGPMAVVAAHAAVAHGKGLIKDYKIWLATEVDPTIRAEFGEAELRQMYEQYVQQQLQAAEKAKKPRIVSAPGGPMIEEKE